MARETEKLANATADALVTTHERLMDTRDHVREQKQRIDKVTDAAGERVRAATLAVRFENWASARLSPRHRRHARLASFDEQVAELETRMGEVTREQAELRDRIPAAEDEYAQALARFHANGKGERPTSAVPALEERIQELAEDYAALEALIGETLGEKAAWVESKRDALVKDAREIVEEAVAEYRRAVDRLVAAREDVVGARKDELYFRLYPHESAGSDAPIVSLVGGVPARLRSAVPGLSLAFGVPELRRLLEADAEFVAAMRTPAQAEALRERGDVRHDREAIWAATEEGQAALRRDRQEARERYAREWGRYTDW